MKFITHVIAQTLLMLSFWGAIGWYVLNDSIKDKSTPRFKRVVSFVFGGVMSILYPVWLFGCWLDRYASEDGNS